MSKLKEILRKLKDDDEFDPLRIPEVISNWPDVDNDGDKESLDMENYELISLSDDQLVMCSGGDWQDPLTLTIEIDPKNPGMLKVVKSEEGFEDGMGDEKFWKKLQE